MVQERANGSTAPVAQRRQLGTGAIASLIGAALLIIFMVQNADDARLHFLVWDFSMPLWLLTLASAILGAVVWIGLGVMRRHRRRVRRRDERY